MVTEVTVGPVVPRSQEAIGAFTPTTAVGPVRIHVIAPVGAADPVTPVMLAVKVIGALN